jgi:hypothetical protein
VPLPIYRALRICLGKYRAVRNNLTFSSYRLGLARPCVCELLKFDLGCRDFTTNCQNRVLEVLITEDERPFLLELFLLCAQLLKPCKRVCGRSTGRDLGDRGIWVAQQIAQARNRDLAAKKDLNSAGIAN